MRLDDITPDPYGELQLVISVHPDCQDRLEALAASSGRTAQQVLEDFMARVFGPYGARFSR